MQKFKFILFLSIFLVAQNSFAQVQISKLEQWIKKKIPTATIKKLPARDHFKESYQIKFQQPLDHDNPSAGTFEHRIFLSHVDKKRPMLFVTEGYNARLTTYELANILQSNQIIVEYRFYGGSRPENIPWQYLTNDQAMEDLHRIKKIFKKMYRKRWVSTGISKGGTTTLIYKAKYPRDVCVAVPYVAPLAFAQEDKRTDEHQFNTGTAACREKIVEFQRAALEKREDMIPLIEAFAKKNNQTFSLGAAVVLEYGIVEFPFAFWQWGGKCEEIPTASASAQELFDYVNKIVDWNFYNDATCDFFLPSFYQFMTELGYYGFVTKDVEDLLVAEKNPTNLTFGPKDVDLTFKPYLKPVNDYLMKKGNKIIYIYGELDTWTACGVHPSPKTDALRMTLKGGAHSTRIKDFSKQDQQKIYKKLKKWLKVDLKEL